MSPPSFGAKTTKLLRILKDTYHIEATLAADITKEAIERAMPTERCKALATANQEERDAIREERLPKKNTLQSLRYFDGTNFRLALHVEQSSTKAKIIAKKALENGLGKIKDGKSRGLLQYCRFKSDPDDYERFDTSRTARWVVSEIAEFTGTAADLPKPITEVDGVRVIDAPVGPVERVKVPGYLVERSAHGKVRLSKTPPAVVPGQADEAQKGAVQS